MSPAGRAASRVGEQVVSDAHVVESVATGEPYAGPPILDGLSPEAALKYRDIATIVRVPLLTESCRASFHAGWNERLNGIEASEAALLLQTLTRLSRTAAGIERRELVEVRFVPALPGVAREL